MSGLGFAVVYNLQQRRFNQSDYYELALQKLEDCPTAMESLGAPPLKVHYINLFDNHNRVEMYKSQIKIPVSGSNNKGVLFTSSVRNPDTFRWKLKQAVLELHEGQSIDLMSAPSAAQTAEDTPELDTGSWK